MKSSPVFPLVVSVLIFLLQFAAVAQHTHIAAGVATVNPTQGQALAFYSGYASGTVWPMTFRSTGAYSGYWVTEDVSFLALSDGSGLASSPEPGHALTGSYLWMEITNVSGPAGAHFGFWDQNQKNFRTTPNLSLSTGTTNNKFKFELSEPIDFPDPPPGAITEPGGSHYIISGSTTSLTIPPDEDPLGHIHERGFTVDQPGDYFIGFTIYEMSTNGPGGSHHHAPSQTYTFHFYAVPEPGCALLFGSGVLVFGSCRARRRR